MEAAARSRTSRALSPNVPNVRVHDASLMRRSVPHSQIAGQLACASYMSPHGAAALAALAALASEGDPISRPAQSSSRANRRRWEAGSKRCCGRLRFPLVQDLSERGCEVVIPTQPTHVYRAFDRHTYRERRLVESFFQRIERFRRIAMRFDKLARNYLAFVLLASVLL